jgi:O-antigen/teichoic acid export membrane protein
VNKEPALTPLGRRIWQAGAWTFLNQGATLGVRILGNVLLTRLLVPEAFGIVAFVQVLVLGLGLLSDVGLGQNIVVHRRGDEAAFLNTAWTIQVMRGFVIWTTSLACAFGVWWLAAENGFEHGTVYADPQLPWIIAVFGFNAAIAGFESTKVHQARRNMRLQGLTQIELASQLTTLVVMLALAYAFQSVWALVVGALFAAVVKVLAGHLFLSGVANRLAWDRNAWHDILHFGKWIFLSSAIGFMAQSGDRLILGALIEARDLGLYAIAVLLLGAVTSIVQALIGSVAFPAISEVTRGSPSNVRPMYLRFQLYTDLALFSAAGFFVMAGPAVVDFLYDDRYARTGIMLSVLSLGLIGGRVAIAETTLLAMGNVRYYSLANSCRMVVLCIGLPLGHAAFGINGALLAVVATQFASWPLAIYFTTRNGLFDWKRELIGVPVFVLGALLGWTGSEVWRVVERGML